MTRLEKTYVALIDKERRTTYPVWGAAMLPVTLIYVVGVLSVGLNSPERLIWLGIYPVVTAEMTGIGYGRIFLKSLWLLLLLIPLGIFNPISDHTPAFKIGDVMITQGWIQYISIILRGLLSFQALLLMVDTIGFYHIFAAIRRVGCPKILIQQLLLTYRYILVVMEEAIIMQRARNARGYGRHSYPLGMWGRFVGQLLLRSISRAESIHRAMLSRGFTGVLPLGNPMKFGKTAIVRLIIWATIIILLRFMDFSSIFGHILQ